MKAIRSKELMMVCSAVRPATNERIERRLNCKRIYDERLTVADAIDLLVREDTGLVPVGVASGLLDESGRKAVSVSFVVGQLGVDKIKDLGRE